MLAYKGDLTEGPPLDFTQGPTIVPATDGGECYLWVATAREIEVGEGSGQANVNDSATRTATECYMRGLKERIEITTNTDDSWRWRRVVFTYKGPEILRKFGETGNLTPWLETSDGYVRVMPRITHTGSAEIEQLKVRLQSHLFKGVFNKDWDNVMNAKLTSDHVNILYDKISTIKSNNGKGVFSTRKMWHPFNKTLIYDDYEDGGSKGASFLSSNGHGSMGDVYVVDFFEPITPGPQLLKFWPQASLYWHER